MEHIERIFDAQEAQQGIAITLRSAQIDNPDMDDRQREQIHEGFEMNRYLFHLTTILEDGRPLGLQEIANRFTSVYPETDIFKTTSDRLIDFSANENVHEGISEHLKQKRLNNEIEHSEYLEGVDMEEEAFKRCLSKLTSRQSFVDKLSAKFQQTAFKIRRMRGL